MDVQQITTIRQNIRNKIKDIIHCSEFKVAANIEIGVYNYALKEAGQRNIMKQWENPAFQQLYMDRLRSIYLNLKNNQKLVDRIVHGELLPKEVAYMTHQEMDPEHWKEHIDAKMKRDASKYTSRVEATTDMFTCKKCHSKRCSYYEMQTRSADEPTTIFVTCQDCGKHWKM